MSEPPNKRESGSRRVHVIACGVLALDLKHVAEDRGLDVSMDFLPGGLHRSPRELRIRLQEAIDAASGTGTADLIAVGYGICGLGTVGIHARQVPLAIPRVHDCISLFLGSDDAYRKQFAACPGTYYVAAGWVEEKSQPLRASGGNSTAAAPEGPDYADLVAKYGEENAEAIRRFMNSWQKNYQRAAFIDTGDGGRKHADVAKSMAQEFGWNYERLEGTRDLLSKLLNAGRSDAEILLVPPHHVTTYDPMEKGLKAVPVWEDQDAPVVVMDDDEEPPADGDERWVPDYGLGIDAGGTYTDAVVYDFRQESVAQKAKSLTTRWDHAIGIGKALDPLDPNLLSQVKLVAVSTTLATNAIVEGQGQEVGLLLMPPYGRFDPTNFQHKPIAVIEGKLEIDGTELAPVNGEQVRRTVTEMLEQGVGAFAVAGYASHVNPNHELAVKAVIHELCDLHVTCGHDISEGLNYRVRAETAALNARIIPYLEMLLAKVRQTLDERGIAAPVMVVKSDGSLMNLETARERPIETILSGPAASVAGARRLARVQDAIVVDMGGTTTDTGSIRAGVVNTCEDGAVVGGWKTHVRALEMRTLGLGGDSLVALRDGTLTVGPRRVAPICWLAAVAPGGRDALGWVERHADPHGKTSGGLDILLLNEQHARLALTEPETRIVDALRDGPLAVQELARRLHALDARFLKLERLEASSVVQRCGLTPTDLLHAAGQLDLWDADAARRARQVMADLTGCDADEVAARVMRIVTQRLAVELLKKRLDEDMDADALSGSSQAMALIQRALDKTDSDLDVRIKLSRPVVGIGAPVLHFLPGAADLLEAEAIIPTHADVANAVGAVTSLVFVRKRVRIAVDDTGRYTVEGLPDAPSFQSFREAYEAARERLRAAVREMGVAAGTSETDVRIETRDQVATLADGGRLFIGRTLEGRLSGRPDLSQLAQCAGGS